MSKLLPHKAAVFGSSTLAMIAAVLAMVLFSPEAASAQTCIQDVWQAHGNNQKLNCTAQDVTLSSATNINITAGGACVNGVCSCYAGQTVTFTADFRMDLTADTRYDVGFYLATDGDPNHDGAITGQCSANPSLVSNTTAANFINLDASPDVCGDITGPSGSAHNPLFVRPASISAPCPSTPGQKLQLPFATTWRQPGSNEVCDGTAQNPGIGNGTTTNDVYPGSPSKCNTGLLTLDITSISTTLNVTKTALSTGVPETGGSATWGVTVQNTSAIAITLSSLTDAPYGDVTTVQGNVTATTCVADNSAATCQIGGSIAAGASCSCQFTANVPPGDFGGANFANTVTGCATNITNPNAVCDDGSADVPYTDISSAPTVTKTAGSSTCRIDTNYQVVVTNTNANETLTLNTLSDNVYGNITQVQGGVISTNCGVGGTGNPGTLPAVIANGGNYSCSFVGRSTACNGSVHDTVTAATVDEDGKPFSPTDDATVVISVTTP